MVNSVINYLNENDLHYIRKKSWPPNSCEFNPTDYEIWGIMEKMVFKNAKQYEDIEGLSAVWNRQTKNSSIIKSTNSRCN